MELLCSTNVVDSSEEIYITIAAILAFIGVAIAAILSYRSNIKTNENNRRIEEAKLKYDFFEKYFEALKNTSKELKMLSTNRKPEKVGFDALAKREIENYSKFECIYNEIMPFIVREKIQEIDKDVTTISHNIFAMKTSLSEDKKGMFSTKFNKEDYKTCYNEITTMQKKYIEIIDNELRGVSENLRSFKID